MFVKGSQQELYDFLNTWISSTFSKYPVVWFDTCERDSQLNAGNIPLVFVDCEGGDFNSKGWVLPASLGKIPIDVVGDGFIHYRVRIDMIDFKPKSFPISSRADISMTTLLLNLPHIHFTSYLGYTENKAQILNYRFPKGDYILEGVETQKPLMLYRSEILVSLALGQEEGGALLEIPLSLETDVEVDLLKRKATQEREKPYGE